MKLVRVALSNHAKDVRLQEKKRARFSSDRNKLDWFGEKLGIKRQEDWYLISCAAFKQVGGESLLGHYGNSLSTALRELYHEFEWNNLLFKSTPRYYWKRNTTQRQYFDWIATQVGVETQQDWYNVSTADVKRLSGASLLKEHHNGSLFQALKSVYPEYEWNEDWMLLPAHYPLEKKLHNQRNILDEIGQQLGIETQQDWYRITGQEIKELGGLKVINAHNNSISEMLQSVYPEFEWDPLLFTYVPHNFWRSTNNQRMLFDRLAKRFGVELQEDWYNITAKEVKEAGGKGLLTSYYKDSLFLALQAVYPEFQWNPIFSNTPPRNYAKNYTKQMTDDFNELMNSVNWGAFKNKLSNSLSKKLGSSEPLHHALKIERSNDKETVTT